MKEKIKSYAIVALGSIIFALAVDWFFIPTQIATGGVTGLGQVVNALVPALPVGMLTVLFNVPLFLLGWRYLGFHMLASSLFSMLVSSVAIDTIAAIHTFAPVDDILACICGGALLGLSLGIVFSQGATTGGTDVVARLLKLKFPWLPMGKLMLIPDTVVLILAAITFRQIESALYGALAIYISTKAMDAVLYGMDTSKVAYIISDSWQEISRRLLKDQDRGVTILNGQGGYTGEEKRVLMVAFKQKEVVSVKKLVHEVDENAFFIVCDAHEVLGEGFAAHKENSL